MEYDYFEGRDENVPREHRRRVRVQVATRFRLRDMLDPFDVSVTEFIGRYRMPQHVVFEVVNLIRPFAERDGHALHIPLHLRVLTALSFYAHGSYQRGLAGRAYTNVSKSSVSKILDEITRALNHPEVLTRKIHFPATRAEREQELNRNAQLELPRVLGLIDGTLIKIVPPRKDMHRRAYMARKGYFCLNVQIVCASDLLILDVNAQFPGAANDAHIYRASGVRDFMRQAYEESRCWLLGDAIYPLEPWMHVPMLQAERGTPEYLYTRAHCKARNRVERCIGVLKERWRCLLWDRTLHYKPPKAGLIVNACVVLHNICRMRNVEDPPLPRQPRNGCGANEEPNDDEEEDFENADCRQLRLRALQERQFLIDYAVERHRLAAQQ